MVEINHKERFLRAKILYYGPAAGGKTTTLQWLHRLAKQDRRQEFVSVNTAQDRTILFDLLPLSTPAFRSYELRFQIIAVPGQKFYGATRKMLLKNADSIVFVANSATDRWHENLQSLKEMTEYLLDHGIEPSSIPLVFQYNKRDLPQTTDLKIMERGLNARDAPSFSTVATEGKGVLISFAAALERTMHELATRYKIGENIGDPRSAKEWTARTMMETFGTTPEELKQREEEAPSVPEGPAPPTKVVRVKAPPVSPAAMSDRNPTGPPATASQVVAPPPLSPPSLGPPASAPPAASAASSPSPSPSVPEIPSVPPLSPPNPTSPVDPPPTELQDARAAQAMVESYADAASGLADHISEVREHSELVSQRVATFSAVSDIAKQLFEATPEKTPVLLEGLVDALANGLHCRQASLSLLRPDGHFEQVIGLGLPVDPLEGAKTPGGRPLARAILEGAKPMVQVRGEAGPLEEAMDRVGMECVSVLALPMRTPVHAVGLLTFYLPQESPAPNKSTIEHLERVVLEMTMALEVISDAQASAALKQSLKASFRGQVAEGASHGLAVPITGVEATLSRMRSRPDAPDWLGAELGQIEACLNSMKLMRDTILGLRHGKLPPRVPTPLTELLERLDGELGGALAEQGVRFLVETKPGVRPVLAEPFLLRGLLYALVESARRQLSGTKGGVIRILTQPEVTGARISVFDNVIAVSTAKSHPSRYLNWPLERRLTDVTSDVLKSVVEYFQGRWAEETRETIGTVRTIILPGA